MPLTYVAWRAGTTYRVVVPVRPAGNRFLGSLKGLQIRALLPWSLVKSVLAVRVLYVSLLLQQGVPALLFAG
jgi:hypothetical protein